MIRSVIAAESLQDIYNPGKALGGGEGILGRFLSPLMNNILIISGLLAFMVIIFAGFNYITASGDKGKVEQAQHMLNYGILGLVLVATAFIITRVIGAVIGFKFF